MYDIALCDDEEKELDQMERLLERYCSTKQVSEYGIRRFMDAQSLLWQMKEKAYAPDIVLLDIFMSGITGMEAAKEMRKLGWDMPIVFLTTSRDHALGAYEVDAVQYLVKPVDQNRFFHAMDSAMGQVRRVRENQLIIKTAGGIRQVQPDDILYCESQKNYQVLYLAFEEYKVRMTTENLWKLLEKFPQFGRCGRSYILNRNHIVSVKREEIVMDNERIIYIPRNKAAEFKKDYFSYYFKQGDGDILV